MQCPRCQQENPAGMKFCGECASPLAATCPSCGAANPPENKFCGQCAAPLRTTGTAKFRAPDSYTPKHLAEKILTSKAALEGERKQVTVLFADLRGSMELLADRDPEEARKLLDPVLEHMMEAVHQYEGTVNQVMGDGIMALFGAPLAHEDHAVRACYAALRMQESIERYRQSVSGATAKSINIRIGLNSGEVVVRAIASDLHMDYTAVGETTHLAARMEQIATPNTTAMTSATATLAEGFIDVRPRGPMPIKGLVKPVEVFELVAVSRARSRLEAGAARGLTTFVGRSVEATQLHDALDQMRRGRGQVVGMVGDPGVGKSRLVWEFTRSPRLAGCRILEARSASYAKSMAYFPVIAMLKAYVGVDDRDDADRIGQKINTKLLSLDRALGPSLSALLTLLDVPVQDTGWAELEPSRRRRSTHEAFKRLILRESQEQPVVLIFEDLHWIDNETQSLLGTLIDSIPTARVLLLLDYRPEYRHDWGSRSFYRQLRLSPLSSPNVEALLHELLGRGVDVERLTQLVIDRTEGNPFFIEESVRSLIETGAVIGERGGYTVTETFRSLPLPATAQAVLAARIDRLDPADKQVLQAAAVVGRDVPLALLQEIVVDTEEAVRARLGTLQAAEFLYEARLFPEVEYTFKHALTQEVAYGGLLQSRRRELHARLADAIEKIYGERVTQWIDQLAYHAFNAELWPRAVRLLRQAGTKAMDRVAFREAAGCFERGLQALGHLPGDRPAVEQGIDLRMLLGNAMFPSGEIARIRELLSEAQQMAEDLGDQRRFARIASFMTVLLWTSGDGDAAIESGTRALAIARSLGDFALEIRTCLLLGQAHWGVGAYRDAAGLLDEIVVRLQGDLERKRLGSDYLPSVVAREWSAASRVELGEFAKAMPAAEEAMRIAETVGNHGAFVEACIALSYVCLRIGAPERIIPYLERAVELCRSENIYLFLAVTTAHLGYAHLLAGRVDEARRLLEVANQQNPERASMSPRLGWFAEAQLRAGRLDEARELATRSLATARAHRERGHIAYALWLHGEIESAASNDGMCERHYSEALRLAGELGMRPLIAHCHLGLGKLYRRTGKGLEANEYFATATTMYREMGMMYWLEKAEAELKELG